MNPHVHPLHTDIEPPQQLNDPFNYEPHPLCILAAEEVKRYVRAHEDLLEDAEKGEMFGVLIVKSGPTPTLGFLAAYAGLLAQRNDWEWFVPPVYDAQQPDGRFKQTEAKISALNHQIEQLTDEKAILELKHRRKEMSNELLLWLFSQYNLINYKGEVRNVGVTIIIHQNSYGNFHYLLAVQENVARPNFSSMLFNMDYSHWLLPNSGGVKVRSAKSAIISSSIQLVTGNANRY